MLSVDTAPVTGVPTRAGWYLGHERGRLRGRLEEGRDKGWYLEGRWGERQDVSSQGHPGLCLV